MINEERSEQDTANNFAFRQRKLDLLTGSPVMAAARHCSIQSALVLHAAPATQWNIAKEPRARSVFVSATYHANLCNNLAGTVKQLLDDNVLANEKMPQAADCMREQHLLLKLPGYNYNSAWAHSNDVTQL